MFSCTGVSSVFAVIGLVIVIVVVVVVVVVVARIVAVRGGNLKNKEAGGGLGGRAQRLPPSALARGWTFVSLYWCFFCCCIGIVIVIVVVAILVFLLVLVAAIARNVAV